MKSRFDSSSDSTDIPVKNNRKELPPQLSESDENDSVDDIPVRKNNSHKKAPPLDLESSDDFTQISNKKGNKKGNKNLKGDDSSDFNSEYSDDHDLLESSAFATAVAKTIQTPVNDDDDDDATTDVIYPIDMGHKVPPKLLSDSDDSTDDDVDDGIKNIKGLNPIVNKNDKQKKLTKISSSDDFQKKNIDEADENEDIEPIDDDEVLEVFEKLNKTYAKGDEPLWEVDVEEIPQISNKNVIMKLRKDNIASKLLKRIRDQGH